MIGGRKGGAKTTEEKMKGRFSRVKRAKGGEGQSRRQCREERGKERAYRSIRSVSWPRETGMVPESLLPDKFLHQQNGGYIVSITSALTCASTNNHATTT